MSFLAIYSTWSDLPLNFMATLTMPLESPTSATNYGIISDKKMERMRKERTQPSAAERPPLWEFGMFQLW